MGHDPRELVVPPDACADRKAQEVIRAWAGGNKEYVSITGKLFEDPGVWGHLFCQLARHVARAYELNEMGSRDDALAAIRERFTEAWNEIDDDTEGELVDE